MALSVSKLGQSGEDWDKWATVVPPEAEPEIRIPGNALRQVRKRNGDKNDTNKGNVTKQVVTMGVDLRAPGNSGKKSRLTGKEWGGGCTGST